MATTTHWRAEGVGGALDEAGSRSAAELIDDLVGSGEQQLAHVLDPADAAADGDRDVDPLGGLLDLREQRPPARTRR